jgi:aldehyde dehydrogenase (NAD+)
VEISERYDHFINGQFVKPAKGRYMKSINPATEEILTEFAEGTSEDADSAVKAARKAYEKRWSVLSPRERGKYVFRLAG